MDFWSKKQSCRLSFMTRGTPPKIPKEPKWNKTYTDKHGHHQKWNEKNTDHQGNQKTTTTGNKQKQV